MKKIKSIKYYVDLYKFYENKNSAAFKVYIGLIKELMSQIAGGKPAEIIVEAVDTINKKWNEIGIIIGNDEIKIDGFKINLFQKVPEIKLSYDLYSKLNKEVKNESLQDC